MTARRIVAPLALASVLVGATACGGSNDSGTDKAAAGSSSSSSASSSASAGASNTLTITTTGMSYKISGRPHPGNIDITFDNTDEMAHEAQIVRLADGKTVDNLLSDMNSGGEQAAAGDLAGDPESMAFGTPALLYGGQKTEVVSDKIDAGNYAVVCFLPGPDGKPHLANGMAAGFTVSGDAMDNAPHSDGTVGVADDGITLPKGFGSGTYEVTNTGTAPHSFSVAKLDGSLDDLFNYVGGQFAQNKPIDGGPGSLVSGVATLKPGQSAWLVVDLPAGHYGYVSTVQGNDPSDTDYARGLHGEFTVS
jgi:uncharacterized cupredoxin-like copper-binding protein